MTRGDWEYWEKDLARGVPDPPPLPMNAGKRLACLVMLIIGATFWVFVVVVLVGVFK